MRHATPRVHQRTGNNCRGNVLIMALPPREGADPTSLHSEERVIDYIMAELSLTLPRKRRKACCLPHHTSRIALQFANQLHQLGSYLVQGQDKIHVAGLDRSFRHAEIF